MSYRPPLILRADAGGSLGSGHVMRCLALGEAWVDGGGSAVIVSADIPEALAARVRETPEFSAEAIDAPAWGAADAAATIALARKGLARAVVADSYKVTEAWLAAIEAAGLRAVAIDDLGRLSAYPCSIIVNPNLNGEEALYAGKADGAHQLLGTRHVMLRREFAIHRASPRPIYTQARHLLVTFGGVDPKGASLIALDALALTPEITAELIVGPANPRADEIAAKAKPLANVTLVRDARDMAKRMMAAEMLLSAGGTTVWEAAALGAPMMLTASAPEEAAAAKRLSESGLCWFLGDVEALAAPKLAQTIMAFADDMAARARSSVMGRELVDGMGAERVITAIRDATAS